MTYDEERPCGARARPGGGVRWRVWAPRTQRAELVLYEHGRQRSVAMRAEGDGSFIHDETHAAEGLRYAYRLNGGPERPDPCSFWQPDGVHRPSALFFPERFPWTDHDWRGIHRADLVLYELHVGTFTPEGTFDAVIPRLDTLRALGVTAIELLPIAQFPGARNWGYDGVHLYAAQNSYGGPHGLQRLVDACHARGLAIVLDVVYNHLGPEGNYAGEFGPYQSTRHHTSWGHAFNYDGPDSDVVRTFVLDNVRHWIGAFHIDGLRLDAVHAMFDTRPRHILAEIKQVAQESAARQNRSVVVIAESLLNDVRMVLPEERGGHGLDAEWNEDFHHTLHALLTGERHGKYVDFGLASDLPRVLESAFVLDGRYSRFRRRRWGAPAADLSGDHFVIGLQNHDHVGNRARGERLASLLTPAQLRLAASLFLLAPYVPMLFMGEEYGEENPFLFFCSFGDRQLIENVRRGRRRDYALEGEIPDPQAESTFAASRLSWSWPEGSERPALRQLYRDLLAARRHWPALHDHVHRTARLVPGFDAEPILELTRGTDEVQLRALFNLGATPVHLPESCPARFSSEASCYGGARCASEWITELLPYECVVTNTPRMENAR